MSAWVPSWDTKALSAMQLNAGKLDEANPPWYFTAADGGITKGANAEAPSMRAALAGVDLMPTIQNYVGGGFNASVVATIVASADLREKHAEALTQLAVQNAYAGIDIDYEGLTTATKANFTTFVQLLAQKLHSANKKLSITVNAKASDTDTWSGPGGQDWRAIGAAADSVKIMAYDNHWNGSAAGAIAPLDWLDRIATYAETMMPAQKVIMGLPWYGYDWQGTAAAGIVYSEAIALAQKVGAQVSYDVNGEATFTYSGHTVYFQDASSYTKKIDAILKKHPQIGGFAHWRAGGEDSAVWAKVATLKNQSSSGATPLTGSFVINGPTTMSAKAGQQTQAAFGLTAIDGFNGTATVSLQQLDAFPGVVGVSQTARVGAPAILTLTPSASMSGTYRFKVRMTSGTIATETIVTVNIVSADTKRRAARH